MSRKGIPNQVVEKEDSLAPCTDSQGDLIDKVTLRILCKEETSPTALHDIEHYLKLRGVKPHVQYLSIDQSTCAESALALPFLKEVYAVINREKLGRLQHKCSRLGLAIHIVPEIYTGTYSLTLPDGQRKRKEAS